MEKSIVVAIGSTGRKFVSKTEGLVECTPFVGQDDRGQFGVGISMLYDDGGRETWMWGCLFPHHLIQSWRAMKLLEVISHLNLYTLHAAMSAAGKRLDEEGSCWGNKESLQAVANVLAMFPTDAELGHMLAIIKENGIKIDLSEIKRCRDGLDTAERIHAELCAEAEARHERLRAQVEERQVSCPAQVPPETWFSRFTMFLRRFFA